MYITDIEVGDELLIKSYYYDTDTYGDTEVNIRTTCTEVLSAGILTDELRTDDGNPINFESDKVCTDVYLIREPEAPIVWKNVAIKRIGLAGRQIHGIVSKQTGIKINRRNRFRVPVRTRTTADFGLGDKSVEVVVRDVSYTGFAIVAPGEEELHQYDQVQITFDDIGFHLTLEGYAVRREKADENRVIYGCIINQRDDKLEEYLKEKERILIQKRKGRVSSETDQQVKTEQTEEKQEPKKEVEKDSPETE